VYRHARGIPRLINTVCENALITAFARQARTVTPDVIDEVAADFRLGIVRTMPVYSRPQSEPAARPPASPEGTEEVWDAVKTLLQLRDYLQGVKANEADAAVEVEPGSRNQ